MNEVGPRQGTPSSDVQIAEPLETGSVSLPPYFSQPWSHCTSNPPSMRTKSLSLEQSRSLQTRNAVGSLQQGTRGLFGFHPLVLQKPRCAARRPTSFDRSGPIPDAVNPWTFELPALVPSVSELAVFGVSAPELSGCTASTPNVLSPRAREPTQSTATLKSEHLSDLAEGMNWGAKALRG
eukprot:CAMPEP_0184294274 /NCGR_PEP_ID=MMETSP1049-20130417/5513_1 /TAXON_ID=77928 /ORGANISM="Proteomonas sulcata, Strain CCMP704" /LENGTH=179 /DNA_ID=CAMNT_0026602507 /DNA_START=427 /DNA_END=966 /DNA_ORIENTATION=+